MAQPKNKESISIAVGVNAYLNHYITVADAKAGALAAMAVFSSGASSLFTGDDPSASLQYAVKISLGLHLMTLLFCGFAVYPRTPSRGDGVIFWSDIANCNNFTDYQERFSRACDHSFISNEYACQNFHVSRVLKKKFFWLRVALWVYFFAGLSIAALCAWPLKA